jgi:hypothetical protein
MMIEGMGLTRLSYLILLPKEQLFAFLQVSQNQVQKYLPHRQKPVFLQALQIVG